MPKIKWRQPIRHPQESETRSGLITEGVADPLYQPMGDPDETAAEYWRIRWINPIEDCGGDRTDLDDTTQHRVYSA